MNCFIKFISLKNLFHKSNLDFKFILSFFFSFFEDAMFFIRKLCNNDRNYCSTKMEMPFMQTKML